MSCEDVDRVRIGAPDQGSSTWPREAREHLKTCARCAKLQPLLESSTGDELPQSLLAGINAAILPGLAPVRPIPGTSRVTAALLLSSIAVIAVANRHLGVAGWLARKGLQIAVDFGLLAIAIPILAGLLARRMTPGSRRILPDWLFLALPPLALLAADSLLFDYQWNPQFLPIAYSCWKIGVTCAGVVAPLYWLALRRGLSLDPVAQCATAGLLAGLTGVTVLEIFCPYLDRLHISAGHVGAAVTAALVGAAVGVLKTRVLQT